MTATPSTRSTVGTSSPSWGRVLSVVVARGFLVALSSLLLWALVPALLGWQPQMILTGSMEPRIMPGDIVVTKPVDPTTLELGQVVTVTDPDHSDGRTRTHRIVRIDDDGNLILRGDNNPMDDSSPVPLDTVHGVGVLRVPYVGRPLLWLGQHQYLPLGLTLLALAWAVGTVLGGLGKAHEDNEEDGDDGDDDAGPGVPGQRQDERTRRLAGQRRRSLAAGVIGMVAVALVAGSGPAEAAFSGGVANPLSSFSAASTFASYADAVTGDAPFLYWRLNEKSGFSVADSSGNNRGGTIMNSTTFGQTGAIAGDSDTAIRLSNEWISQTGPAAAAPAAFSLEAWIRTTSTTGGRIIGFGNKNASTTSTSIDRSLYLGNNGKVYFALASEKTAGIASGTALNDGQWHHVVATYANSGNGGMRLYVDGTLAASGKGSTTPITGWWRAGGDAMSGYTANPNDSFFDGTLDEVAVYTDVLTPTEIAQHDSLAG